jgi:hypothetical protein
MHPEERTVAEQPKPSAVDAADAELVEVSNRLAAELRRRHPELFDRRGRVKPRVAARLLSERTGGKHQLTREELFALQQDGP